MTEERTRQRQAESPETTGKTARKEGPGRQQREPLQEQRQVRGIMSMLQEEQKAMTMKKQEAPLEAAMAEDER
jgi:hypothetical protein